jgi:hypothetical protein
MHLLFFCAKVQQRIIISKTKLICIALNAVFHVPFTKKVIFYFFLILKKNIRKLFLNKNNHLLVSSTVHKSGPYFNSNFYFSPHNFKFWWCLHVTKIIHNF